MTIKRKVKTSPLFVFCYHPAPIFSQLTHFSLSGRIIISLTNLSPAQWLASVLDIVGRHNRGSAESQKSTGSGGGGNPGGRGRRIVHCSDTPASGADGCIQPGLAPPRERSVPGRQPLLGRWPVSCSDRERRRRRELGFPAEWYRFPNQNDVLMPE